MYVFVDTEFTDFRDTELISLGIVSEDGLREFYVEITDHTIGWRSDFVNAVVVPMLDYAKFGKPWAEASLALKEWLDAFPEQEIVFVVDFMMDHYLMSEMFKANPPQKKVSFQMIEKAFGHMLHERGYHMPAAAHAGYRELVVGMEDYFEDIDKRRHHALVDAKANRHGWLKGYESAKRA